MFKIYIYPEFTPKKAYQLQRGRHDLLNNPAHQSGNRFQVNFEILEIVPDLDSGNGI